MINDNGKRPTERVAWSSDEGADHVEALRKDIKKRGRVALDDLRQRDPAGCRMMMAFVRARMAEGIATKLPAVGGRGLCHAQ